MKAEPEGPGWWMASDGRWYPPELHPAVLSGDVTADELRAVPLSGRADRTTIRWVAEADTAGSGSVATAAPASVLPVGPAAGERSEPTWPNPGEPEVVPEAEPAPAPRPAATAEPAPASTRVRGGVATSGVSDEYVLPPERPSRFLLLGVAAAALALIAISAFTFLSNSDDVEPSDTGTAGGSTEAGADGEVATAPVPTSVSDLVEGDCLQNPELEVGDLSRMTRADCADPHTHEVYLVTEYEPADDPFELSRIRDFATTACQEAFEGFVGVPYVRSRLLFVALGPTRDTWADGERAIACLVYDPAGQVTGTLRDAEAGPTS